MDGDPVEALAPGEDDAPLAHGMGEPRYIAIHRAIANELIVPGGAYNQMEEREFRIRFATIREFDQVVVCWLEALDVIQAGLTVAPVKPIEDETKEARVTQILLYHLATGTAKAGLDAAMGGNFPAAFASIRMLLESVIAIKFLHAFPRQSKHWWRAPVSKRSGRRESPPVSTMVEKFERSKPSRRNDRRFMMAEANITELGASYDLMSLGDHVTPEMLKGMVKPDGSAEPYPTTIQGAIFVLLASGLEALANVLGALALVHQLDPDESLHGIFPEQPRLMEDLYRVLIAIGWHAEAMRAEADAYIERQQASDDA